MGGSVRCQFLIGKVQLNMEIISEGTPMKEKCQFLIGKVQHKDGKTGFVKGTMCQFLIGKVQHENTNQENLEKGCQFLIGKVQH